jgi:hypothetical protein
LPYEKFLDLINIWIQKHDENLFQVSPLVYQLGIDHLPQEVILKVHLAIAKTILSRKQLDQTQAANCINSLLHGEDYNSAGIILIDLYQSASSINEIKALQYWGLLNYWIGLEIPKQMATIIRASIRLEQIKLFKKLKKDISFLLTDFESFLTEPNLKISEQVFLNLLFILQEEGYEEGIKWEYFDQIYSNWDQVDDSFKEEINNEMIASTLWMASQFIQTNKDIEIWIQYVSKVEEIFRINFFENEYAQTAITLSAQHIVKTYFQPTSSDSDQAIIFETLDVFASYFYEIGIEPLEAVIHKEIIGIQYNIDQNEALQKTEKIIERFKNSDAIYLLKENFGKLLYRNDKQKESKPWLVEAIKTNCIDQSNYPDTLIYAACVISEENSQTAVEYCSMASQMIKEREQYSEIDDLQFNSELAVAYWINNEPIQCLESYERVVTKLFDIKNSHFGKEWIRILSWIGHSLGYIARDIARNKVPEKVSDGGDYFKPYQGIFSFNTKDLSDIYDEANEPILYAHLALLSEGIGDIERAYAWSLESFDRARRAGKNRILYMLTSVCSQYALINFKVEEALETHFMSIAISTHIEGPPEVRYEKLDSTDLDSIYNSKPSQKWNEVEDSTVTFVIIPLFIKVLYLFNMDDINLQMHITDILTAINNYHELASDQKLWKQTYSLCEGTIDSRLSQDKLIEMSNRFGVENRKNLQVMSILGFISKSSNTNDIIDQTLNVLPYIDKLFSSNTRSIVQHLIAPFFQNRLIFALKKEYVGSKEELEIIKSNVMSFDVMNENCLPQMIQPVVETLEFKVTGERKKWLYEYKEIC